MSALSKKTWLTLALLLLGVSMFYPMAKRYFEAPYVGVYTCVDKGARSTSGLILSHMPPKLVGISGISTPCVREGVYRWYSFEGSFAANPQIPQHLALIFNLLLAGVLIVPIVLAAVLRCSSKRLLLAVAIFSQIFIGGLFFAWDGIWELGMLAVFFMWTDRAGWVRGNGHRLGCD